MKKRASLKFPSRRFIRMSFDMEIRRHMRELWLRKRMMSSNPQELENYYFHAFSQYLDRNRIPKQTRKRTRTQARLLVTEPTATMIKGLEMIARSRQQPLAAVIEQALEEFLDRPENFMGKDKRRIERREFLDPKVTPFKDKGGR